MQKVLGCEGVGLRGRIVGISMDRKCLYGIV